MATVSENNLAALYDAEGSAGLPPAWEEYRGRCWSDFTRIGLPDSRTEGYRHTPLRKLFERGKVLAEPAAFPPTTELYSDERFVRRMVLINGRYAGEGLCEEADGTVWGSLREAAERYPDVVARNMGSFGSEATAESALNGAFARDGAFVHVPEGVSVEEPFLADIYYSGEGLCFPRLTVNAEAGARLKMVVTAKTEAGASVVADRLTEIRLGEGASLEMLVVSEAGGDTVEISSVFVSQASGSRYAETFMELSDGGFSRTSRRIDLNGTEARCELRGLFMAGGEQVRGVDITVNHVAPGCTSNQLVKGIVRDKGVGSFRGLVRVHRDAQKTEAYQQSRNVQLGDTAHVYTEPQLEIYADDVKCSHGATVGRLDGESVFYMRQRGLSLADARRLQLTGFVRDVMSGCPYDALCARLAQTVDSRLERIG